MSTISANNVMYTSIFSNGSICASVKQWILLFTLSLCLLFAAPFSWSESKAANSFTSSEAKTDSLNTDVSAFDDNRLTSIKAKTNILNMDISAEVTKSFDDNFNAITKKLKPYAVRLFWSLAVIQFALSCMRMLVDEPDLSSFMATIIQQVLIISFFYEITNNPEQWIEPIVKSFETIGTNISNQNLTVVDISKSLWDSVLRLSKVSFKAFGLAKLGAAILFVFLSIIILMETAIICAYALLTKIMAHCVVAVSMIYIAFGGNHFTRDIALRAIMAVIAISARLLTLYLLIAIASHMLNSWVNDLVDASKGKDTELILKISFIMVFSTTIFLMLVLVVPNMIGNMIAGSTFGSQFSMLGAFKNLSAAAAAGTVGMAGQTARGTALAASGTYSAYKLSGEQMQARKDAGLAPESRIERGAMRAKDTANNMKDAALASIFSKNRVMRFNDPDWIKSQERIREETGGSNE